MFLSVGAVNHIEPLSISVPIMLILIFCSIGTIGRMALSNKEQRAKSTSSPICVFIMRAYLGFSLGMISATVVEAAERSGFMTWKATGLGHVFRFIISGSTGLTAAFADATLGSYVPVENGALMLLQGLAGYVFALHRTDKLSLCIAVGLSAAGFGMANSTLPVLGSTYLMRENANRSSYFHQFFLWLMLSMIIANCLVVCLWDIGLWIAPLIAFIFGCIACITLWCSSQNGSVLELSVKHDTVIWAKLWPCVVPAMVFIIYYVGFQQNFTIWYLQAKAMNNQIPIVDLSVAPSIMQIVFYITRVLALSIGTLLAPKFTLPSAKYRCIIGVTLMFCAVLCSAYIQRYLRSASILFQTPQFILMGIAESTFLPAHLELLTDIASPGTKHLTTNIGVMSHFVACGVLLCVEPFLVAMHVDIYGEKAGSAYLLAIAVLLLLAAFTLAAWKLPCNAAEEEIQTQKVYTVDH